MPLTLSGSTASSTDPSTWSTYRDAARSRVGAGLGFVLDGDGLVVVDLDHCLDGGQLAPWAARVLDLAGPTWVERSQSGEGLHVWGRGQLPAGGRRIALDGCGTAEVYGTGRYIAVTGETWGGTPRNLGDVQDLIDALVP